MTESLIVFMIGLLMHTVGWVALIYWYNYSGSRVNICMPLWIMSVIILYLAIVLQGVGR